MFLKQSTTVTIKLGPFLDPSDGVTEETALTPAVEVAKNGGAFAARNSATAVAHDAEGFYDVELDATDTGTLGVLVVKAHDAANHLPVWQTYLVLPAAVYDTLVAGTDQMPSQVEGMDTDVLTAAALAAGAAQEIRDTILSDSTPFAGANIDAAISSRSTFDPTSDQVDADVVAIDGAAVAPQLRRLAESITIVTLTGGGHTASVHNTDLAEATADHYVPGVLKYVTGALAGQQKDIVDYDGAGAITTVPFTEAPADTDIAIVL